MIPGVALIIAAYAITHMIQTAITISSNPQIGEAGKVISTLLTGAAVLFMLFMAVRIVGLGMTADAYLSNIR